MNRAKSKVTLYMRPELHKMLKLRAVEQDMKMSELAEIMLERALLASLADGSWRPGSAGPLEESPARQPLERL